MGQFYCLMVHPAFIYVLLLLAGITVQLACAQNFAMQPAPLPVIEGKINGMDVVAQGDSVAFFAGKLPREYSDKSCAEDLHCVLHKNHTRAVMISPEGISFFQLNPNPLEEDQDEEDDSSSLVLPSQTLNTLDSSSSFSFKELFISTEEIEPTPTLATLYTGNPLVDQTPGLAWINSETIKLLATTVETLGFLSTSTTSTTGDDFTLVNPSPTETMKVMTITGELDGLRRQLMSSATVPVPTPVQTNSGDPELESGEVWLETGSDVLKIRPSPTSYGGTATLSYSVRRADVTSGGSAEPTPSASHEPTPSPSASQPGGSDSSPAETEPPRPAGQPVAGAEKGADPPCDYSDALRREAIQGKLVGKIQERDFLGVRKLLRYSRADPDVPYDGVYPLVAAFERGRPDIIKLLREFSKNIDELLGLAEEDGIDLTVEDIKAILGQEDPPAVWPPAGTAYKVLLPTFAQELAWARKESELSVEARLMIGFVANGLRRYPPPLTKETREQLMDKRFIEEEVDLYFPRDIRFGMPDFLNPVLFDELLARYPARYQPASGQPGPVLDKEPLVPKEGEPEIQLTSFRELILRRIRLRYSEKELEDPDNPGHLPPLAPRELRELILRCGQPDYRWDILTGRRKEPEPGEFDWLDDEEAEKKYNRELKNSRDYQLRKLLCALRLPGPIDQSDFDRGGLLEHWRYVPEYTAEEKRAVLVHETESLYSRYKSRVLTAEEIARKTKTFQGRSDDDIHYGYGDCLIHYMVEDFFGRLLTPEPTDCSPFHVDGTRIMSETSFIGDI